MRPLPEWPSECLLLLADQIPTESDLNALTRTNRRLHHLLNPYLYRRSIQTRGNMGVLRWAIWGTRVGTTRHCLSAGVDPDIPDDVDLQRRGALHRALEQREVYRVNPKYLNRSQNSMKRLYARNEELVRLLLERGADINGCTAAGKTPLHTAASSPDLEMVRFLVEKGADVSIQDTSGAIPLYYAASVGDEGVVRFLLERGSDPNNMGGDGCDTPLHEAAEQGHVEAVTLLLAKGAKVEARDKYQSTPLHRVAQDSVGNDLRLMVVMQMLIDGGADTEAINWQGYTPLQGAVMYSRYGVLVECLVRSGANVDVKDRQGRSLKELAREHSHAGFIKYLHLRPEGVGSGNLRRSERVADARRGKSLIR